MKKILENFLIENYELDSLTSKKIAEKLFYILENNLLEWNKITCKWEII